MAPAPRAKRRRTYHHGDLESALLDASIELITTKGADAFTLREVARRVGVDHAAAYRHFADKNMLLEAIAARGYAELAERLEEAVSPRAAFGRPRPPHEHRRRLCAVPPSSRSPASA